MLSDDRVEAEAESRALDPGGLGENDGWEYRRKRDFPDALVAAVLDDINFVADDGCIDGVREPADDSCDPRLIIGRSEFGQVEIHHVLAWVHKRARNAVAGGIALGPT